MAKLPPIAYLLMLLAAFAVGLIATLAASDAIASHHQAVSPNRLEAPAEAPVRAPAHYVVTTEC